jgi:hypothetical protein
MTAKRKRLRPGQLDPLVLAYMRKHKADAPLTATAVGKGLGRSAGAVANCPPDAGGQGMAGQAQAPRLRAEGDEVIHGISGAENDGVPFPAPVPPLATQVSAGKR